MSSLDESIRSQAFFLSRRPLTSPRSLSRSTLPTVAEMHGHGIGLASAFPSPPPPSRRRSAPSISPPTGLSCPPSPRSYDPPLSPGLIHRVRIDMRQESDLDLGSFGNFGLREEEEDIQEDPWTMTSPTRKP